MKRYRIVPGVKLPGAGRQRPTTEAVLIEEGVVVNSSSKAVQLKFPTLDRTEWVARSQLCTHPDYLVIDRHSKVGDFAAVLLPLYIFRRWYPKGRREPMSNPNAT